ncbi:hypothetical protein BpHYR1_010343 [Brachionus plicatilis]|uniref:Uncharacterized protein n=1 Tax=Brachionus plicatilis TaxID=10195 RepID=A0A3M7R0S6_BRAPC|nr:hypothetical protein BpHYR1_010343 [Brachionus plicatilis]
MMSANTEKLSENINDYYLQIDKQVNTERVKFDRIKIERKKNDNMMRLNNSYLNNAKCYTSGNIVGEEYAVKFLCQEDRIHCNSVWSDLQIKEKRRKLKESTLARSKLISCCSA